MPSEAAMKAARELIVEMRETTKDLLGGTATFACPLSVQDIAQAFDEFSKSRLDISN